MGLTFIHIPPLTSMGGHIISEIRRQCGNLNKIEMAAQLLPQEGPRFTSIHAVGEPSIHFAAGEYQQNVKPIVEAFGEGGWVLQQSSDGCTLRKTLPLGVLVQIDYVSENCLDLPKCIRIPVVHSVS